MEKPQPTGAGRPNRVEMALRESEERLRTISNGLAKRLAGKKIAGNDPNSP